MRATLLLSGDAEGGLALARSWAATGAHVTLFLLDEAAALARPGHPLGQAVSEVIDLGVSVGVHDTALRRRGLDRARVADGLKVVTLDEVADLLADSTDRAVWL